MDTVTPVGRNASSHWRILVVDNETRTRKEHISNLEGWGYQVFHAEGEGHALLSDAQDKAKKHRCHLALVDMRLLDDSDRTDTSGLDLVRELKPTESIIGFCWRNQGWLRGTIGG